MLPICLFTYFFFFTILFCSFSVGCYWFECFSFVRVLFLLFLSFSLSHFTTKWKKIHWIKFAFECRKRRNKTENKNIQKKKRKTEKLELLEHSRCMNCSVSIKLMPFDRLSSWKEIIRFAIQREIICRHNTLIYTV